MSITPVLYVRRRDAKTIKSHLEDLGELDKRFRMLPTNSDAIICDDLLKLMDVALKEHLKLDILSGQCIAVPVLQSCIDKLHQYPWSTQIVGAGVHYCPFSTSMGNSNRVSYSHVQDTNGTSNDVQRALADALFLYSSSGSSTENGCRTTRTKQGSLHSCHTKTQTVKAVLALSNIVCPKKLEIIGDDRTLVVPRWSLYLMERSDSKILAEKRKGEHEFLELLLKYGIQSESDQMTFQSLLWKNLAATYRSSRVVRRGDIDPESGVRESGRYRLIHSLNERDLI